MRFAFWLNVAMSALNACLYVAGGHPIGLTGFVINGAVAGACLLIEERHRERERQRQLEHEEWRKRFDVRWGGLPPPSPTDHAIAVLDALGIDNSARHPLHRR